LVITLAGVAKTNGATAAAKVRAPIPFNGMSAMIFLPSPVEDTVAHNQHPSAEPSRQRFLGHKGNHRYRPRRTRKPCRRSTDGHHLGGLRRWNLSSWERVE
jgi:hypothetical protein